MPYDIHGAIKIIDSSAAYRIGKDGDNLIITEWLSAAHPAMPTVAELEAATITYEAEESVSEAYESQDTTALAIALASLESSTEIPIVSVLPTPAAGKLIYFEPAKEYFRYDPVRESWLSESTDQFLFAENNISSGRMRIGNVRLDGLSVDGYLIPYPITIVGWSTNSNNSKGKGTLTLYSSGKTVATQTIKQKWANSTGLSIELGEGGILNIRASQYSNLKKINSVIRFKRRIE